MNQIDNNGLPLGFGMALAQNMEALQIFSSLPPAQQQDYLQMAHHVSSKEEMEKLVESIAGR